MAALKVQIYNQDGTSAGELALEPKVFGVKANPALVHEVVVAQEANARETISHTKTRGEVRGGGKKPWKQKHTGQARHGSTRSPIWVGGGVVFGPRPRDYGKKVNAKVKQLAFSRALFDRATAGELAVIEAFDAKTTKTKAMDQILGRIAPKGRVLLVDAPFAAETARASRNIARVALQEAGKLNTLDLAQHATIVVSTKALEAIIARVNGGKN